MLSFRHRDKLAAELVECGFHVIAARRASQLAARFAAIGARALLVDARDAAIEALQAVEALAADIDHHRVIILAGPDDAEMAPAFARAGAGQILVAPWSVPAMEAAVIAASRTGARKGTSASALMGMWRVDFDGGALKMDPEVAAIFPDALRLRDLLAHLPERDRPMALSAIRRLRLGARHAVFRQHRAGDGQAQWIHHMTCHGPMLVATVERLADAGHQERSPQGMLPVVPGAAALVDAIGEQAPDAIGMIELGRLSLLNDSKGRDAGDALIAEFGQRLQQLLREDDAAPARLFRSDGARFAVVPQAAVSAQRLGIMLRAVVPALMEELDPDRDIALRIATARVKGMDAETAIHTTARRLAAPRARAARIDVGAVLAGDGLNVLFQPQYAMQDDAICGAEALLRWRDPRLGELSGATLFAAAAGQGLSRRLSQAMWERTFAAMAGWTGQQAQLRIAINVTGDDLGDDTLDMSLLAMLERHGIAPQRITVEVTEAALIERLDAASAMLQSLRDRGVCVALDDFGTGYSSLSWLRALPVDYLKLDASFVAALDDDRSRLVVQSIVDLAQSLGLSVLAEGVETETQRAALAAMGVARYQGFLRAAPLPAAAFAELL